MTTPTSEHVYYSTYQLPFGPISVASTDRGICACFQGSDGCTSLINWLKKHFVPEFIQHNQEYNQHIHDQLGEYFAGSRQEFELTYDMRGTDFQVRTWQQLQQIPYGQTITYGELAVRVGGSSKYSRAVGGANNKNPIGIIVPCHRVIGTDGKLVGYAGGLEMKNQLLLLEKGCLRLLD